MMPNVPSSLRILFTALMMLACCTGLVSEIQGQTAAKRELLDRVVAIVGQDVITATELATQVQMYALQSNIRPSNETEMATLQRRILDQMISDRLLVQEAKKDTSISVRPDDVERSLDEQLARLATNLGSPEALAQRLEAEGLTLRELRRRYSRDIENQLLRQRLVQGRLSDVTISRPEVEQFYQQFRDSLPATPEGIRLAHILLPVNASPKLEDSVKQLATKLRERILAGADFATVASQYSGLGTAESGGDLGFVAKEDLVPEFARAAFQLQPGEISGTVRTQFGWHVIKCEEKREERARLRQILLPVTPTAQDTLRARQHADSILTVLRAGAPFDQMAKDISTDSESRAQGGELGWFALAELPDEYAEMLRGWTTPNDFRGPLVSRHGVHIFKLLEHQAEEKLDLKKGYDKVKELARQQKTGQVVDEWLASIRKKTYVVDRLDEGLVSAK